MSFSHGQDNIIFNATLSRICLRASVGSSSWNRRKVVSTLTPILPIHRLWMLIVRYCGRPRWRERFKDVLTPDTCIRLYQNDNRTMQILPKTFVKDAGPLDQLSVCKSGGYAGLLTADNAHINRYSSGQICSIKTRHSPICHSWLIDPVKSCWRASGWQFN